MKISKKITIQDLIDKKNGQPRRTKDLTVFEVNRVMSMLRLSFHHGEKMPCRVCGKLQREVLMVRTGLGDEHPLSRLGAMHALAQICPMCIVRVMNDKLSYRPSSTMRQWASRKAMQLSTAITGSVPELEAILPWRKVDA